MRQKGIWGPIVGLTGCTTVALALASQGCGGSDTGTGGHAGHGGSGGTSGTSSSATTTSSTGTGTTGTGGANTGGMGGTGGVTGDLTAAGDGRSAFDATPDLDAAQIYFTAIDAAKGPGVFKVPGDGSNPTPVTVAAGAPFVSPFGIAIGTDGSKLYVTDPGADAGNDHGAIFVLSVASGAPTALAGSEDTTPRSLEVVKEGGADVVYFTGSDKADGQRGVFKIAASGGALTVLAKGAPFVDPSGIAVAADGTVYVADTVGSASRVANIIKVDKSGAATVFLADLRVGYPCGVALSFDEKTLLVSALDPAKGTDVLLQIDVATAVSQNPISGGIDTFYESAGLHRAKAKNVFAWADSSAGPASGRVFVVK
jgi:hypothetical protein